MAAMKPEEYLKIGPRESYGAFGVPIEIQEIVPEIFSCDLVDNKLEIKKDISTYRFPSGHTFHDILDSNNFKNIKTIGSGATNTTDLVEIEGQLYLLRRPSRTLRPNRVNITMRKSLCAEYFRECVHLAILSPSPYVMKLLAAECSPSHTAMLLEYVEGMTLSKWITSNPSIEEKERVKYSLINGVNYLHSKLIVHYDIKPDNIFVPKNINRAPFFIDFGSSGRFSNTKTALSSIKKNLLNLSKLEIKITGGKRQTRIHKTTKKRKTTYKRILNFM